MPIEMTVNRSTRNRTSQYMTTQRRKLGNARDRGNGPPLAQSNDVRRLSITCLLFALAGRALCSTIPLTGQEVSLMLRSGYSSDAVLQELSVRHFGGTLDSATETQLLRAGASQSLIDALHSARYQASPSEMATARQKRAAEEESAARDIEQTRAQTARRNDGDRSKGPAVSGSPGGMYRFFKGNLVYWHEGTLNAFDDEALENKKLYLLFFSAFGSPQARRFTPKLIEYYNRVIPEHPELEVIFFSLDRSEFAMNTYISETKMPWPAIAYDKLASKQVIVKNLVRGVPCLILVDGNGTVLSNNGGGPNDQGPEKVLADLDRILAHTGG
jgi:Thioredoxin-like